MLGVWVNRDLVLELIALGCCILKVSNQPLISDVVLLPLPTFNEKGNPDHNDDAIEDTKGRLQIVIGFFIILNTFDNHCNSKS